MRQSLIFITMGEPCSLEIDSGARLKFARDLVLEKTPDTQRLPGDWEIRNEAGVRLNPEQSAKELGLLDGQRLFLALPVGTGA